MMCGGTSEPKPADEEAQTVCDAIKDSLKEKVGKEFTEYKAILVSRQTVAGTNFFVKIHIGNEEYVHARIYRPLPGQGELELHSHQPSKQKDDALSYF